MGAAGIGPVGIHDGSEDEVIDDGTTVGEIPGFDGVWGNAPTFEACRDDLMSVLEGWIVLGLRVGHELPYLIPFMPGPSMNWRD